jgi:hypothetical protein
LNTDLIVKDVEDGDTQSMASMVIWNQLELHSHTSQFGQLRAWRRVYRRRYGSVDAQNDIRDPLLRIREALGASPDVGTIGIGDQERFSKIRA